VAGAVEGGYTPRLSASIGEECMKTNRLVNTLFALVAIATVTVIAGSPADAAAKKKTGIYDRHTTRLTVRRPFTDPGTETLPLDEHYHDYAFSPTYTPYPNLGGIVGFWRAPLPSPIDLPGSRSFGY
jgi:hypothetical protein